LSDIHGNLPALLAVTAALSELDYDHVLVAGDSLGYYANTSEVLNILASHNALVIAGNHERMYFRAQQDENFLAKVTAKYGTSIQDSIEKFTTSHLLQVQGMPEQLKLSTESGLVCCFHGSPRNSDEYVYPDSNLDGLNNFLPDGTKWVVLGHTHHPMDRMSDSVRYINPGSVGQPRNQIKKSQWAMLDTKLDSVQFFQQEYNRDAVIEWAEQTQGSLPYLADVLRDNDSQ
jgi:putative phosphoesterase